jgi:hypothetical protein
MKKLVAISVLFVILAAAVFAQDDEGKWKVGFMARYVTDMLFATSMTGKSETKNTDPTGSTDTLSEYGKFNKGSINFFSTSASLPHPDYRMLLSLSTSGENYEAYADIAFDNWENWGSIWGFLQRGSADWYLKGNAGIFNGQVGNAGYGGWVSTQATWNDWYGWNQLCRFGVWRPEGFLVSNEFRTWNEWGSVAALGATFADNYKLSLGYRFDGDVVVGSKDPTDSTSAINGSFMLNARVSDAIAFDLFYAVKGQDTNTFSRPVYILPTLGTDTIATDYMPANHDSWDNIIGVFVGINAIENLGLSLGYTANFRAYEAGGYVSIDDQNAATAAGDNPATKSKPFNFSTPFYSGIDIRLNYSGIDKIGLTFNNNISLAGVKGEEIKTDGTTEKIILGFGSDALDKGFSEDWFHWDAELKASFSFIENLGLTLHLGNRLSVLSSAADTSVTVAGITATTKGTSQSTDNEFRVSLFADYGIGAVNVGIGLFLGLHSKALESESTTAALGFSNTTKVSANSDVVTFGIPIMFKVQF